MQRVLVQDFRRELLARADRWNDRRRRSSSLANAPSFAQPWPTFTHNKAMLRQVALMARRSLADDGTSCPHRRLSQNATPSTAQTRLASDRNASARHRGFLRTDSPASFVWAYRLLWTTPDRPACPVPGRQNGLCVCFRRRLRRSSRSAILLGPLCSPFLPHLALPPFLSPVARRLFSPRSAASYKLWRCASDPPHPQVTLSPARLPTCPPPARLLARPSHPLLQQEKDSVSRSPLMSASLWAPAVRWSPLNRKSSVSLPSDPCQQHVPKLILVSAITVIDREDGSHVARNAGRARLPTDASLAVQI